MAKMFYTNGTGSQQTLTPSQNEKVAVYQTLADAEADLANLEVGQIISTPDTGTELAQPVDVVESGNMNAVTSNAVYEKGNDIETFELTASDFASSITDLTIRFAKGFYNPLTHMVSLTIDIYSPNNLIPVINNTICTISNAKYRPRAYTEGYAVLYDDSSTVKWEACFIDSNGKIALGNFMHGNRPVKAFAFTISYFAN